MRSITAAARLFQHQKLPSAGPHSKGLKRCIEECSIKSNPHTQKTEVGRCGKY